MDFKVKITKRAFQDLQLISDYILNKFGEKPLRNFKESIFDSIGLIQEFPLIGSIQQPEKGYRGYVIHKNTKVFYKLKNKTIIFLRFYDNRQKEFS